MWLKKSVALTANRKSLDHTDHKGTKKGGSRWRHTKSRNTRINMNSTDFNHAMGTRVVISTRDIFLRPWIPRENALARYVFPKLFGGNAFIGLCQTQLQLYFTWCTSLTAVLAFLFKSHSFELTNYIIVLKCHLLFVILFKNFNNWAWFSYATEADYMVPGNTCGIVPAFKNIN